jgi:hypothetical protein
MVSGMATRQGQRWRQLVVWLHVITSVGWMGQALTLVSLLAVRLADPGGAVAATTMASYLDLGLLAPLANASAFTGLLLAVTTSWGLFRHWWVAAKFAITLTQLYVGIFLLSPGLDATVTSARAGSQGPTVAMLIGGVLMAGAIGFQAWLSIAKPWRRIRPSAVPAKLPTAPRWVFAVAASAVCADLALAELLGYPLPVASAAVLVVALVVRRRAVSAVSTIDADKVRRLRLRPSGVQALRTALLVILLLGLQRWLWQWLLGLIGDSAAAAVPDQIALHQVVGWLGTAAMGAALVAGVCSWLVRDSQWPVRVTGVLALVVCGVFAVAGLLMTVANSTLPLLPLGLLLVGVLLWLPLAGVATAGRRCLITTS